MAARTHSFLCSSGGNRSLSAQLGTTIATCVDDINYLVRVAGVSACVCLECLSVVCVCVYFLECVCVCVLSNRMLLDAIGRRGYEDDYL